MFQEFTGAKNWKNGKIIEIVSEKKAKILFAGLGGKFWKRNIPAKRIRIAGEGGTGEEGEQPPAFKAPGLQQSSIRSSTSSSSESLRTAEMLQNAPDLPPPNPQSRPTPGSAGLQTKVDELQRQNQMLREQTRKNMAAAQERSRRDQQKIMEERQKLEAEKASLAKQRSSLSVQRNSAPSGPSDSSWGELNSQLEQANTELLSTLHASMARGATTLDQSALDSIRQKLVSDPNSDLANRVLQCQPASHGNTMETYLQNQVERLRKMRMAEQRQVNLYLELLRNGVEVT